MIGSPAQCCRTILCGPRWWQAEHLGIWNFPLPRWSSPPYYRDWLESITYLVGFEVLFLPYAFILVFCLAYSSIINMEATCYSQTSVDFQRTTRRYISEYRTLHNLRWPNSAANGEYEYCFQGCNAVWFGDIPTLRKNVPLPSLGWGVSPED
jgi:hypothetical protein